MRKAKIQTMVTKQMSVTIYLTDVKKKKNIASYFRQIHLIILKHRKNNKAKIQKLTNRNRQWELFFKSSRNNL